MVVRCGGVDHVVELSGDDLVLADHDEDAESVIVALGGEPPPCVSLAAVWRNPPWPDVVPCLLLGDDDAVAASAGKDAAAAGLAARLRSSTSVVGVRGVDRLRTSALLLGLPPALRRGAARRALRERVAAWRAGVPMPPAERDLLERALDPLVARLLEREGRHLPPGGRPVHVHLLGPDADLTLVPGRRSWDALIPVQEVDRIVTDGASPAGRTDWG